MRRGGQRIRKAFYYSPTLALCAISAPGGFCEVCQPIGQSATRTADVVFLHQKHGKCVFHQPLEAGEVRLRLIENHQ
jgi:hypothetical protein